MKKKWMAVGAGLGSLGLYLAQNSLKEKLYKNVGIFDEATKGVIRFFNDNLMRYVNWPRNESVKNYQELINYFSEKLSLINKQVDTQLIISLGMIGVAILLPLIVYKLIE